MDSKTPAIAATAAPGRAGASPALAREAETHPRELTMEPSSELSSESSSAATAASSTARRRWTPGRIAWLALFALAAAAALFALLSRGGETPQPGFGDARAVPVRGAEVTLGELAISSTYAGEIVGEVTDIAPQVSGRLDEVAVRIGDRVRARQVVAVIDDVDLRNQLQEARSQLEVALANRRRSAAELEGVEADHRRSQELYSAELLSDQEHDRVVAQLATARANLGASDASVEQARARVALLENQTRETRVVAPFDGVVAARYLDRGALVQKGTPLLRLVEDAPLLVQFRVPERDLGAVQPGVPIEITTQATGSRAFHGEALRVSGEVSRTDRTATVEGRLEESVEVLRPGMYAEVSVTLRQIRGAKIVPDAAVVERVAMDGTASRGVFVVVDDTALWTPIEVLGRSRGRAAIDGPVEIGQLVLTLGHTELRDGSPVRVVQQDGDASAGSGDLL